MNDRPPVTEAAPRFRPREINVRWEDPWDGVMICSSRVEYDSRHAATGSYSKWIRRVKENAGRFAGHILQDRLPRVRISFIY